MQIDELSWTLSNNNKILTLLSLSNHTKLFHLTDELEFDGGMLILIINDIISIWLRWYLVRLEMLNFI